MTPPPPVQRLDILGTSTASREWGAGAPVVMLHGLPTSGLLFRRLAPQLAAQGHLVCAPDLPGFGESADLPGFGDGLPSYGRWLAAFLRERFGDAPVHLIGQDYGGLVAAWCASVYPCLSLTLSSCPLDAQWRWLRVTAWPGLRQPFYRWLKGGLYLYTAVPRSSRAGFVADHLTRARSDPQMAQRMEAIAASLSGREVLRLRGQVGALPTLCLWGGEDKVFAPERGWETARALPAGSFHSVSGGRHGVLFSHPEACALEWALRFGVGGRAPPRDGP